MDVMVILAHPKPGSFNHAVAGAVVAALRANGHRPLFHDLYQERFDPVLPHAEIRAGAELDSRVAQHCQEVAACDGLALVHPNWWGGPPAILKGWVDRVLRAGVAYRFEAGDDGEGVPVPLLKARSALVFNTTDTPMEREQALFGDPLETVWKNCILRYCGVEQIVRRSYGVVVTSTPDERRGWLEDVRERTGEAFPRRG